MPEWTRRDLLRASAGAAAIAVPMAALAGSASTAAADDVRDLDDQELAVFAGGQVVFSVRDAARGEVAIYHGVDEVIVRDRALVARIMRAANTGAGI